MIFLFAYYCYEELSNSDLHKNLKCKFTDI